MSWLPSYISVLGRWKQSVVSSNSLFGFLNSVCLYTYHLGHTNQGALPLGSTSITSSLPLVRTTTPSSQNFTPWLHSSLITFIKVSYLQYNRVKGEDFDKWMKLGTATLSLSWVNNERWHKTHKPSPPALPHPFLIEWCWDQIANTISMAEKIKPDKRQMNLRWKQKSKIKNK